MKRILVPVDFSDYSVDALKVAAQIARKNNFEIIIVHVLELPQQQGIDVFGNGSSIPEIIFFKNKAMERLTELLDSDFLKGIEVLHSVEIKKVEEGVIESSIINGVDFIVMGSNGTSGFNQLLVGSNTEKIVRLSSVPVLVIKNRNDNFNPKNFVFATNFSIEERKPFERMLEYAKLFDSKLFLVNVCTPSNFKSTIETEKNIKDFVSTFDLKNFSTHIFNDSSIENGIINFADSVHADLIGTCTHGRTGLSLLYNGSITEDLVNHAAKPILTFKI